MKRRGEAKRPWGDEKGSKAELGMRQVFRFVKLFAGTMAEGLSPPHGGELPGGADPRNSEAISSGTSAMTLALVQEHVDIVAVVSALGPWMARWRLQEPDISAELLEVSNGAMRVRGITKLILYSYHELKLHKRMQEAVRRIKMSLLFLVTFWRDLFGKASCPWNVVTPASLRALELLVGWMACAFDFPIEILAFFCGEIAYEQLSHTLSYCVPYVPYRLFARPLERRLFY